MSSKMAFPQKEIKEKSVSKTEKNGEVDVSSYCGISRPKIVRKDGTEWPWNSFVVTQILF